MPVLINFKICDNSEDCSGIEVCPTGAFHWNGENKTIAVAESECTLCGDCEQACPVGAIRVALDEDEYERIKREIDEDPRKISDLFTDRYGAEPIDPAFLIPERKFGIQILRSTKPAVAEFFRWELLNCLLHSIPIRELFEGVDVKYRKVEITDDNLLQRYGVGELPALLFFESGELVGKIEGYYDIEREIELKEQIDGIIAKIGGT